MGLLRFSEGDVKVNFTRPFQLLDKGQLTNIWKGLVNVTFTSPLLKLNSPISNTVNLLKG